VIYRTPAHRSSFKTTRGEEWNVIGRQAGSAVDDRAMLLLLLLLSLVMMSSSLNSSCSGEGEGTLVSSNMKEVTRKSCAGFYSRFIFILDEKNLSLL
jgi:hypothetical protein